MNEPQTKTLQKTDTEKGVEFIPYGAADKIKLSVKIIQNMVAVPTKTGRTCSERDALRFLMLCQAQRLNPFAGDAFLIGYDGQNGPQFSLITAHQAFLKRAETCKDFEGMESGIILLAGDEENPTTTEREGDFHLESEKVVGGWARVHRTGRKDTYRRIRLARFNNGFAQWKVDPAGMIVKCAEADALRSTFPTLLGGLYIQGEGTDGADKIVSQMSANRISFEPSSKLVESSAPVETKPEEDNSNLELAPVVDKSKTEGSSKSELEKLVTDAGFTFGHFKVFATAEQLVKDADSLGEFGDLKEKDAERLLRAKTGLLNGMKQIKEQEGK